MIKGKVVVSVKGDPASLEVNARTTLGLSALGWEKNSMR